MHIIAEEAATLIIRAREADSAEIARENHTADGDVAVSRSSVVLCDSFCSLTHA